MENDSQSSNPTNNVSLTYLPDSHSTVTVLHHPFLVFDPNSDLSLEDKSAVYCSLVTLVKVGYRFDNSLQDRAAQFLKSLEPKWVEHDYPGKLVTNLVPSSAGSLSGFLESIVTLLSSPHSTVVTPALSFLFNVTVMSSPAIRCPLVELDLISNVLATMQPHTLPISGNEEVIDTLSWIIIECVSLASPFSLRVLGITTASDAFNHREMIFQKVVLPSSQFVTFLISNRHILDGQLLHDFTSLLSTFLRISPFHRPILEYVVASPIAITFTSCLTSVEKEDHLETSLINIDDSPTEWKKEGAEVAQSEKQIMQALISEGIEDTLEQMLMSDEGGYSGANIISSSHSISKVLGSNLPKRRMMILN